jgi:2-methylcitrate dehydratase PrpD
VDATIDALIHLRNLHNLKPDDVEQIQCEVARFCLDSAGQKEPKTGLASKFSIYYCAALALTAGVAGEDRFTDKLVFDPKMYKFRTLAAFVLPKRKIDLLAEILWALEKVEDIRQVSRLCH